MPRITPFRLAAACTLALVLSLTLAAGAAAKGVFAELRVVGKRSQVLAEQDVRTGPAISVKTSPKATCFGKGTGGSGKPASIQPNTAMGVLAQAAKSNSALRPLGISDSFSFGLALCGVGKSLATGGLSWYLKVNHKGAQTSGDHVKLRPNDEVLWALEPYPYPDELALEAPGLATPGVPFTVHVFSYDEKGKRKPVAGASVTGAAAPTGADGATTVTLNQMGGLVATHGKDIPSPVVDVCAGSTPCEPSS
jgi:hypothetical protein